MALTSPGLVKAGWERLVAVLISAIVLGGLSFLSWIAYLIFCAFLVRRTGDAASLRHAATAARAFRAAAPAALAQAVARLVTLGRSRAQ